MRKMRRRAEGRPPVKSSNRTERSRRVSRWRALYRLTAVSVFAFAGWLVHIWWQTSNDTCSFDPKNPPRGTLYWGGAGLDGPYIERHARLFAEVGIHDIYVGKSLTSGRWLAKPLNMFADAVRAGLLLRNPDSGDWAVCGMKGHEQFNLIGYSYGSSLAAQTALAYAKRGVVVDHLVLIAPPIGPELKAALLASPKIKVYFVDLREHGDPLYPGISTTELVAATPTLIKQMVADRGDGHFYYAHDTPDSDDRIRALARQAYHLGVR